MNNNGIESFTKFIFGAERSIDIVTAIGYDVFDGSPYQRIAALKHSRLALRAIVPSSNAWSKIALISPLRQYGRMFIDEIKFGKKVIETKDKLESWGWKVKVVEYIPNDNVAIIDKKFAIIYKDTDFYFMDSELEFEVTYSIDAADQIYKKYEEIWSNFIPQQVLYENTQLGTSFETDKVVIASNKRWGEIIKQLSQNPKILYDMNPRKFEELVAELLIHEGMRVQLTPQTKDGGVDILAFSKTQAGEHLYYVECKRYSPNNPVDVSIVRSLYGIIESNRVTAGLLVTSSYFTKGALSFRESVKHRLSLKDYDVLVKWLKHSVS